MPQSICLVRLESSKNLYYRILVIDSRLDERSNPVDYIGSYSPSLSKDDEKRIQLHIERLYSWLDKGAQLTASVERLLKETNVDLPKNIEYSTYSDLDAPERISIKLYIENDDESALDELAVAAGEFVNFFGYIPEGDSVLDDEKLNA